MMRPGPFFRPDTGRPDTDEAAFAAALLDPDRPTPASVLGDAARFRIYRNNVTVALVDALAATFPAVSALTGETFFRAAAREFARAHPPRSPVLIEWGGDFPDWVGAFPPAATVPYLADVARLDWAWSRAWNAAEAEPSVDVALALSTVPPEELSDTRLVLHPSVGVVASPFPVVSLWEQATRRAGRTRLDLGEAETALVSRPADAVEVRRIHPVTATFLDALGCGVPLGRAAEFALSRGVFVVEEQIAGIFTHGLVAGIRPARNAQDTSPGATP